MTTTTTHTNNQHPVAPDHPTRIFAQWGLPHTVTPRFGARLIQSRYRLDFLSDRASLIGEWSETQIAKLDLAFPEIIKALEAAANRRAGCSTSALHHYPARRLYLRSRHPR